MVEHGSGRIWVPEPTPPPWQSGGGWDDLQPHLPARALPIVGVYDEVWPDRVPRLGWQVWYSAHGDLRVADANGDPVWIVHADDEAPVTEELAKPARIMLEPRTLDDFWDVEDYTFGCTTLDAPAPLIAMRDAAGVPALYFELDPTVGLIKRVTSPDLPSDEFRLELRDYRVADDLPDDLFRWTGEVR